MKELTRVICGFSVILFLITEGLSFFNGITKSHIIICWSLILIICLIKNKERIIHSKDLSFQKKSWLEYVIRSIPVMVCLVTGYLSFRIVPNNWDSMTYHLARVANWIQVNAQSQIP